MSFKSFLRAKLLALIIYISLLIFLSLFFIVMHLPPYSIIFFNLIFISGFLFILIHEFIKKSTYYNQVKTELHSLDQKYLLSEVIHEPEFLEGQILYHTLRATNKSMNDTIDYYKRLQIEYEEYIELWIHEIKTPIASAKLIIENHPSPQIQSIGEEIDKISSFIEQVLFYSRSHLTEKDYIIKALSLRKVVHTTIRKHAKTFIALHVNLQIDIPDYTIYSDSKWLEFILGQILTNALKYLDKPNKTITLSAIELENSVQLTICDNGIGIPESDIARVFDKGFTGENGRRYGKSTGMGLYLCHKLAVQLGLKLTLTSTFSQGTSVTLSFPKGKLHLLSN